MQYKIGILGMGEGISFFPLAQNKNKAFFQIQENVFILFWNYIWKSLYVANKYAKN